MYSTERVRAITACALVAGVVGCDGVGRPLVGRKLEEESAERCPSLMPACEPPEGPAAVEAGPQPWRRAGCAPDEPPASWSPSPDSMADSTTSREGAEDTGDARANQLSPLHCAELTLELSASARGPADGFQATRSELTLSAQAPTTLTLSNATLDQVSVRLLGPVHLRFDHGTLRASDFTLDGSAELTLSESSATGLTVEPQDAKGETKLSLVRTQLSNATLIGHEVLLESDQLDDVRLRAQKLLAVELFGENAVLDAQAATISYSSVSGTRVTRCGRWLVADSVLEHASWPACSEGPLRIHGSSVVESQLDGKIEAVGTEFIRCTLGAGQATELEIWQGSFTDSSLCAHVKRFAIGTQFLSCNQCPNEAEWAQGTACGAEGDSQLSPDANPACLALADTKECDPPVSNEHPRSRPDRR